jgi:hypothetical protein
MCIECSSFIRVRGSFLRDPPVAGTGGVMVRTDDWYFRRTVTGFLRWKRHPRTKRCGSNRNGVHRKARCPNFPKAQAIPITVFPQSIDGTPVQEICMGR